MKYKVGIDVGGTFTDFLLAQEDGTTEIYKVLSTSGICKRARESDSEEFIIGTEIGMLHRLKKENPEKRFYPASNLADCSNMKLNNLEKILWSLEDMIYPVEVAPDIARAAKRSIDRMLEIV